MLSTVRNELIREFHVTFIAKKDMNIATTSDSIWKLSAMSAIELVMEPTTNSITKKLIVRLIMKSRRGFLPSAFISFYTARSGTIQIVHEFINFFTMLVNFLNKNLS